MGEIHSISEISSTLREQGPVGQQAVLRRAVAKLVLIGEQVGVGPSEMIAMLESGLTVAELLDYLTLRGNDVI